MQDGATINRFVVPPSWTEGIDTGVNNFELGTAGGLRIQRQMQSGRRRRRRAAGPAGGRARQPVVPAGPPPPAAPSFVSSCPFVAFEDPFRPARNQLR